MAELSPENTRFPALARHKDVLDTLNSLSWFLMDAAWMMGSYRVALSLSPLVVLSAAALTAVDRRPALMAINGGIMAWIFMNMSWMISDIGDKTFWLAASRGFFVLGCALILSAAALSENLRETFSHFRRFRLKDWA